MKGASPSRAFWGLGRLGRALGWSVANSAKVPSCWRCLVAAGPFKSTRARREHPTVCPPPRSGGGKGVHQSRSQPGKSELRDETVSRLSPGNLPEHRGDMVGVAGWGGGHRGWRPQRCAPPAHAASQATVTPQAFLRGRLTFISAQSWGCPWKRMVIKDSSVPHPHTAAEQPSKQNAC